MSVTFAREFSIIQGIQLPSGQTYVSIFSNFPTLHSVEKVFYQLQEINSGELQYTFNSTNLTEQCSTIYK